MKNIGMMTPAEIAFQYDGDKRKIGQAVQNGILPPTLGALAGLFIDRTVKKNVQAPQRTVAEDLFAAPQAQAQQAAPQGGMGLDSLPVDESMVPSEDSFASGGIVAFANRGFVETPGGLNVLADEMDEEDEGGLGKARKYVDMYREMLAGAKRGPASEEFKKYYEGAAERGAKAAEQQRWTTGLGVASKLLSTRGDIYKALGAAGEVAAPGLQKAAQMEEAATEAGLKGRLAIEDKERAEELEAIKGGMNLYGKEREREITSGKDLAMDKYAKNFLEAYRSNPKYQGMSDAQIMQLGREDYLNRSGAALLRGQAAVGGVDVSASKVQSDLYTTARTAVTNRIKGDFRLRNRLSKLEKDDPPAYEAEIDRMVQAELSRMPGGSAAAPAAAPAGAAPAPKKGNAMFPSKGGNKISVKAPDGQVFQFDTQAQADAFKQRIGGAK